MFKETPAARCLRLAFVGGVAGLTIASTAAVAQEVQKGERIEVTGSNIRRAQTETASPVQTITREDLARSGKSTVSEYLQTLALDNAGSVPTTFGNGFSASGSGISLRHPVAATGRRILATLTRETDRRDARYGLETMCIGGGQGLAAIFERV